MTTELRSKVSALVNEHYKPQSVHGILVCERWEKAIHSLIASELSELQKENAELKKWKEEDPRMLREQIRVADVAFNALQERYNSLRTQNRELREACVQFIAWYHVDPFKGDKHWKELPDIIRQAEQALALQPEK